MANYVDVIYNEKIRPCTDYPFKLCEYLFNRFKMNKEHRLLDVGCGRGEFMSGFKAMGLEVSGIDKKESKFHADNELKVKYIDIKKELFPFDSNSFDVVFCKSVIEHLLNPENLIRECYRVLKPGGRIIIMTPDWVSQMKIFFDDYTHRMPYTVTAVKDLLSIFDFKDVESEIFYQLPVLWKYPALKMVSAALRKIIPVTLRPSIKFVRWSIECMVLGSGVKNE